MKEVLCLQQKLRTGRAGVEKSRVIAVIARDRKARTLPLIATDNTDQERPGGLEIGESSQPHANLG